MNTKEKSYQTRKNVGESVSEYGKRLKVKIIDTKFHGYNIVISAYKLEKIGEELKKKSIKVRKKPN